jgi:serine/threonine protein kinase
LKLQKTQYTPPEESQSFASDLWASGVTLLELVLGKPVTENFVLNEINVPDVHPHLLDLIQQLLSM